MKSLRTMATVVATAVLLLLLGWASALPVEWHENGSAVLRLSWRARPERIETCRAPSADELARMAEHMRQRVICEGTTASYLLRVEVDGELIDSQVVRGGGWRNDRPLQLLNEHDIKPGLRHILVSFDRRETPVDPGELRAAGPGDDGDDDGTFAGRAEREAEERRRSRQAMITAHLVLDTTLSIGTGRVLLVTLDQGSKFRIVSGEM